jgi:hypothetical protein
MQDDACAPVVDHHGVRLINMRKKILTADESLIGAYNEVCMCVCVCVCVSKCGCGCVCVCV